MELKPLQFTVPFDEADGEGIVFFGNYFRLAHRALEAYLPQLGIPWKEWFANSTLAAPLRHAEADYMSPLKPGQTFQISVSVEKIGDSSAHFIYEFKGEEGQAIAKLKTSHVFIHRELKQKASIPESIRQSLARGLV